MIVPNSHALKGGKERGGYGLIWEEEEGNDDHGVMVQSSQ